MDRLKRWLIMRREGGGPKDGRGVDRALAGFIGAAIELRMERLQRYFTLAELASLDSSQNSLLAALESDTQEAIACGVAPRSRRGVALARRSTEIMRRVVRGDATLLAKLLEALREEPILRASAVLSEESAGFLRVAAAPSEQL